MSDWANRLVAALRSSAVVRDVASEAQDGGLRLYVDIDRQLAGRLGVSVQNVSDTLYDAFGQRQVSTIYAQTNQYRVILEAQPRYLADPTSLKNLYVSSQHRRAGRRSRPLPACATTRHRCPSSTRSSFRPSPSASTLAKARR